MSAFYCTGRPKVQVRFNGDSGSHKPPRSLYMTDSDRGTSVVNADGLKRVEPDSHEAAATGPLKLCKRPQLSLAAVRLLQGRVSTYIRHTAGKSRSCGFGNRY